MGVASACYRLRETHEVTALRNSTDSWHSAFRANSSKAADTSGTLATCIGKRFAVTRGERSGIDEPFAGTMRTCIWALLFDGGIASGIKCFAEYRHDTSVSQPI